jgi:ribosomal protein L40E
VNCWSCQAENPSSASFCFNCGSRLVPDPATEAPCRSCGSPLPLDARFCGNCGTAEPVAPAAALPVDPAPVGLADMLEPAGSATRFRTAPPLAADEPSPAADATALAYDHEEEDEATILRGQLEEAPMIEAQPGPKSRDRLHTEPAKVAVARTLAERLGRSGDSPGAYSKQGPSLRKPDAKGKPPPPPAIGSKAAGAGGAPPAVRKKADTERSLPRTDLPARPLGDAEAKPKASKIPPVPGIGARPVPRPAGAARPAAPPPAQPSRVSPAPASPVAARVPPAAAASTSGTQVAPAPVAPASARVSAAAAASTSGTQVAPAPVAPASARASAAAAASTSGTQVAPAPVAKPAAPAKPRATTEPQKVVFASPRP